MDFSGNVETELTHELEDLGLRGRVPVTIGPGSDYRQAVDDKAVLLTVKMKDATQHRLLKTTKLQA